jgi:hypothetical protein
MENQDLMLVRGALTPNFNWSGVRVHPDFVPRDSVRGKRTPEQHSTPTSNLTEVSKKNKELLV